LKKSLIFFSLFILFTFYLNALEPLADISESRQQENLLYYALFPLYLPHAPKEKLQDFYFLDEKDITILSNRKITSWKKLKNSSLSKGKVELLTPYITFKKNTISLHLRAVDLESKHKNKSYIELSEKLLFSSENFSTGFLAQKDAQETHLLDYYSWFFQYKGKKKVTNLIFGNYKLSFGQGILFGSKFSNAYSTLTTTAPLIKNFAIKPYTSFYENWSLRGLVTTIKIKSLSFTPYYSQNSLDASIKNDSVSSFYETGLHPDESKKDKVVGKISGIYLSKESNSLHLGINTSLFDFDKPFLTNTSPQSFSAVSFDFNYAKNNFFAFGEYAKIHKQSGKIIGVRFLHHSLDQIVLFRDYQKLLPTFYGGAMSQSSSFDNEQGIYYGVKYSLFDKMKVAFYTDLWKIPQTSHNEKVPISGREKYLVLEIPLGQNSFHFHYKIEEKEKIIENIIDEQKIRDYKFDYKLKFYQSLKLQIRYHYREKISNQKETGFLTFAMLQYKNKWISWTNKATHYKAKTLIYMYQHNVDGIMQTTSFSGEDLFYYSVLRLKIFKTLSLQGKYASYWDKPKSNSLYLQFILKKDF